MGFFCLFLTTNEITYVDWQHISYAARGGVLSSAIAGGHQLQTTEGTGVPAPAERVFENSDVRLLTDPLTAVTQSISGHRIARTALKCATDGASCPPATVSSNPSDLHRPCDDSQCQTYFSPALPLSCSRSCACSFTPFSVSRSLSRSRSLSLSFSSQTSANSNAHSHSHSQPNPNLLSPSLLLSLGSELTGRNVFGHPCHHGQPERAARQQDRLMRNRRLQHPTQHQRTSSLRYSKSLVDSVFFV